jgi:diguanylate cyclase (GGDEF)-like protein
MSTDLALWQWSTVAQLVSGVMIAGFFLAFRRSFRQPEVATWAAAWLANLGALLVTDMYWFSNPTGIAFGIACAAYFFAKLLFGVLLMEGAFYATGGERLPWGPRQRTSGLLLMAIVAGLTVPTLPMLGVVTHTAMTLLLAATVWMIFRRRRTHVTWLALGIGLRAVFSAAETLAYSTNTAPPLLTLPISPELMARFLAVSSSFDTAAEWMLALGCVLAVTSRAQQQLEITNRELREAQDTLRAMVDVDPLTGLANRRALPAIMRDVQPHGAALVFLDLRGFKEINDVRGHHAGDEALRRFAAALRDSFRPEDHVVRYAGDEFVVVTTGLSRDAMRSRVDALRARLTVGGPGVARIQFDAGHAELEPGGMPDEALRAADLAMYEAKEFAKRTTSLPRR